MATSPVLPITAVPGHPADPVDAFHQLIASSPSSSPDHPLLSYQHGRKLVIVTILMLASALATMIQALDLDTVLYSLHSLHWGGATSAYRQGLHWELIKRHGLWSSNSFWLYITSPCVASSPVSADLARAVEATSTSPPLPHPHHYSLIPPSAVPPCPQLHISC